MLEELRYTNREKTTVNLEKKQQLKGNFMRFLRSKVKPNHDRMLFAPVIKVTTLHLLFALATQRKMGIYHFDANATLFK